MTFIRNSFMPNARLDRRGLTLIEMLLAIALTLALMGSMFAFYFNVLSSRSVIIEHMRQQQAATTLISWIDSDLATCVAGDATIGAGVKGDSTNLRVLTRGIAARVAAHGADDPEVFSDLQLAEYRFNANELRIEGRRAPTVFTGTNASSEGSQFSSLDGTIHHLRFRYFSNGQWQDSFNSLQADRLPAAVEIALWLNPVSDDNEDVTEWSTPSTQPMSGESTATAPVEMAQDDSPSRSRDELPSPDRVRVIVIPDSHSDESLGNGERQEVR